MILITMYAPHKADTSIMRTFLQCGHFYNADIYVTRTNTITRGIGSLRMEQLWGNP